MLLALNVITPMYFSYYALSAYLQLCIRYEYLLVYYIAVTSIHYKHTLGIALTHDLGCSHWPINLYNIVFAYYYILKCLPHSCALDIITSDISLT